MPIMKFKNILLIIALLNYCFSDIFAANLEPNMPFASLPQDFIDLFTGKQSAHLGKYVHMHRPEVYDQVVNQDTYYPFRLECNLINNHAYEIVCDLSHVSQVIELGPGSDSPVKAKSVPMVRALTGHLPIEIYSGVDINREYAAGACKIISDKFPNLKARIAHLDFTINSELAKLKAEASQKYNNIIICFGGTIFCAGKGNDVDIIIGNISSLLKSGEYFIFGADISDNEDALKNAYFNELSYQLMLNAMFGLKSTVGDNNFDATAFDPVFKWNKDTTTVELFLKANRDQEVIINSHSYQIMKDILFNILNSRKTSICEIKRRLAAHGMEIIDVYETKDNFGNKFALLKTKKI